MPLSPYSWERETSFESNMQVAHAIIDRVMQMLEPLGWSGRDLFAVQMALEEGLMNAVSHGNKNDPAKRVHFAESLAETLVRFRIIDEGEGFDPDDLPDPTAIENLEVASGRGVHLIRGFMTTVEFNDDGTILQMEKVRSVS